jgi:KDO2-lipid IV(A) lauroyltransferase
MADISVLGIYLAPPLRKLMEANLKTAFPEKSKKEISALARKSFSNLSLSMLEFFWFVDRPDRLEKYTVYGGDAKAFTESSSKGFIFVTPHLGNWELAGLLVSHFDKRPFAVIARTVRNPYINKLINSGRMIKGNKIISSKGAVKNMLKALREGYGMATLIDQNTRVRDGGIFVDFFGLPVPASRAPAMFAKKLDIPVVVAGCIRKGRKYESFVKPLSKKASEYSDEQELTQELMNLTESLVREYPDQYLWLYKRFQNIPKEADEELIKKYPGYASVVNEKFYSKPLARKKN